MPRLLPRIASGLVASGLVACAASSPPAAAEPEALAVAAEPAETPQQAPVVAIPGARNPAPGIVTGGAPSEENLRQAKDLGYHTVISLLPAAESQASQASQAEGETVTGLGMHFVSIPIAGAEDLTEENARKLGDVLAAPQSRPLILHCSTGNRAGALLALHAFYVDGATPEDALSLGEAAGLTKLRDAVQSKLQAAAKSQP